MSLVRMATEDSVLKTIEMLSAVIIERATSRAIAAATRVHRSALDKPRYPGAF